MNVCFIKKVFKNVMQYLFIVQAINLITWLLVPLSWVYIYISRKYAQKEVAKEEMKNKNISIKYNNRH